MATGPEDPLARMVRWDALRQRLSEAASKGLEPPSGRPVAGASPAAAAPERDEPLAPTSLPEPAAPPAGPTTRDGELVLQELAEVAQRLVAQQPGIAVTITVAVAGATGTIQVAMAPDGSAVTVAPAEPPRAGEASRAEFDNGRGDRSPGLAAARLAELLRHDPSLLSGRPAADA